VRVLVTGALGQVGAALSESVPAGVTLQALTHQELDIADAQAVDRVIGELRPEILINTAAYTAVDRAEDEPALAMAINGKGPANLARALKRLPGSRLLHVSTDYVFDGQSNNPYQPDGQTQPLGVYGRSKLEGERAVRELLPGRATVLRTAWVYAAGGKNFVLTMLRQMREHGAVRVVADQRGTPTCADSVAEALWKIAQRPDVAGMLHWTDAGSATWFEFAVAIAEEATTLGLLTHKPSVSPITSAEFPTRAIRPANSVLDLTVTATTLGLAPRPWRQTLYHTLEKLAARSGLRTTLRP
jgi:dTDP-4-dehydrorhamnose reductase